MSDSIGHASLVGFAKGTTAATWGYGGTPAVVGAGHGFEVDQLQPNTDSQYLENMGVSGQGTQRPGVKGSELVAGSWGPMDLYYEGHEVPLALAHGQAGAPTQQGGTAAYLHALKIANSVLGLHGTLVSRDEVCVMEFPFVKIGGFELSVENGQQAKITYPYMSYGVNYNVGSPDDDALLADVLPVNGAVALLAGGNTALAANPSPVLLTITDADASLTALVAVIIYTDIDGVLRSETWTYVPGTFTFTTSRYAGNVTSVTLSGVVGAAGADRIKIGYTAGVNNQATYSAITLPASREIVTFGQMKLYITDQGGAGSDPRAASFEQYISSFNLRVSLNLAQAVTTKDGRRTDEPRSNGFITVEGGFNFDLVTDRNLSELRAYMKKNRKRMLVEFTGPEAATGYARRIAFFMNEVVYTQGAKGLPGPGKVPLDMTFKANRAASTPTGFPTGYTQPLTTEIVSTLSTDPLA